MVQMDKKEIPNSYFDAISNQKGVSLPYWILFILCIMNGKTVLFGQNL